jgi:hypothetical protein
MGYQTDFVGYLHVQPALNHGEIDLINTIERLRYENERGGLQAVDGRHASTLALLASAPRGWSNWAACSEGCCLSYDGGDKANHMIRWLRYLMATYLVPGATAEGKPGFEDFTFDHVLNGMVVGSRRDNRQLYSITARENEVESSCCGRGCRSGATTRRCATRTRSTGSGSGSARTGSRRRARRSGSGGRSTSGDSTGTTDRRRRSLLCAWSSAWVVTVSRAQHLVLNAFPHRRPPTEKVSTPGGALVS